VFSPPSFFLYKELRWCSQRKKLIAKVLIIIKRTLRQFGYPPDMQKLATETVF